MAVNSASSEQSQCESRRFWCAVCGLDLQSEKSLEEHKLGKKHQKRERQQSSGLSRPGNYRHDVDASTTSLAPAIDEEEFFQNLASGKYKNIVVLTGAGVSTAAGIPDFRSPGGLYETLQDEYRGRFPGISVATPEVLFSRAFARMYPEVYEKEILPSKQKAFENAQPTLTHHFCAHLFHQGWLRRVYTQNIDGLHLHPSLGIDNEDVVVECHGSIRKDCSIVLYGDSLPNRFGTTASRDFSVNPPPTQEKVDLFLVFGTSLQVAPVCGLPNLALKGCTRVLVNRDLSDCMINGFSARPAFESALGMTRSCDIGSRKNVPLRPLWRDRKALKKWSQLLVEDDCDSFVARFMKATETSFLHREG